MSDSLTVLPDFGANTTVPAHQRFLGQIRSRRPSRSVRVSLWFEYPPVFSGELDYKHSHRCVINGDSHTLYFESQPSQVAEDCNPGDLWSRLVVSASRSTIQTL